MQKPGFKSASLWYQIFKRDLLKSMFALSNDCKVQVYQLSMQFISLQTSSNLLPDTLRLTTAITPLLEQLQLQGNHLLFHTWLPSPLQASIPRIEYFWNLEWPQSRIPVHTGTSASAPRGNTKESDFLTCTVLAQWVFLCHPHSSQSWVPATKDSGAQTEKVLCRWLSQLRGIGCV